MKRTLVIPTNRPNRLREFFSAWRGHGGWDSVIVVYDMPSRPSADFCDLLEKGTEVMVCDHANIEQSLGPTASWIISRRDSAIRCFGFWMAWKAGATEIGTLDDDTRPIEGGYPCGSWFEGHVRNLRALPKWVSPVPGFRPRGLPYFNLGVKDGVRLSVGLWRGIPDQDAVHQLAAPIVDYVPPEGSWLLAPGQYAPLCGMNLAFTRQACPLMYFGLQGSPWPYRRFDDIACGIWAKRVCDHLGWGVAAGEPHVRHERASDPMANLVKEAPGVAWNENFWPLVDGATLVGSSPSWCMRQLGEHVAEDADPYHKRLGEAMRVWGELFEG